jgi:hypothetical protein
MMDGTGPGPARGGTVADGSRASRVAHRSTRTPQPGIVGTAGAGPHRLLSLVDELGDHERDPILANEP